MANVVIWSSTSESSKFLMEECAIQLTEINSDGGQRNQTETGLPEDTGKINISRFLEKQFCQWLSQNQLIISHLHGCHCNRILKQFALPPFQLLTVSLSNVLYACSRAEQHQQHTLHIKCSLALLQPIAISFQRVAVLFLTNQVMRDNLHASLNIQLLQLSITPCREYTQQTHSVLLIVPIKVCNVVIQLMHCHDRGTLKERNLILTNG